MKKIFIIGFMGCGKTTVGKRLSSIIHFDFIDSDNFIEKKEKKSITEIFRDSGEQYFREIEQRYLKEISLQNKNMVISTGGGTSCYFDNMEFMKQNGITVYIKMHPDSLLFRIQQSKETRPLLEGMNDDECRQYIYKKIIDRESYYSQAEYIVKGENINVGTLAAMLGY